MLGAPGDYFQEVFNESYSLFCVECCRLGHSVSFCRPGTVRNSQGKNGKHVDLEMVLTKQVKKKSVSSCPEFGDCKRFARDWETQVVENHACSCEFC